MNTVTPEKGVEIIKLYRQQRSRIQHFIKIAEKRGYHFPENIVPPKPKKVTKASVNRLAKLTPDKLYSKATIKPPEARKRPRIKDEEAKSKRPDTRSNIPKLPKNRMLSNELRKKQKPAKVRKKYNQFKKDKKEMIEVTESHAESYNDFVQEFKEWADENDVYYADIQFEKYNNDIDKLVSDIDEKINEMDGEEKRREYYETGEGKDRTPEGFFWESDEVDLNFEDLDREKEEPEPGYSWLSDEINIDFEAQEEILIRVEEEINKWTPLSEWSEYNVNKKTEHRNRLKAMLEGAIMSSGRASVAQRMMENADVIEELTNTILYKTSGTDYYLYDISPAFIEFAAIIKGGPLTPDESMEVTYLGEQYEDY